MNENATNEVEKDYSVIIREGKRKYNIPETLTNYKLSDALDIIVVANIALSVVGGLVLLVKEQVILGLAVIISNIIFSLVISGISRIIKQNNVLIKMSSESMNPILYESFTLCPECNTNLKLDNEDLLNMVYECPICKKRTKLSNL